MFKGDNPYVYFKVGPRAWVTAGGPDNFSASDALSATWALTSGDLATGWNYITLDLGAKGYSLSDVRYFTLSVNTEVVFEAKNYLLLDRLTVLDKILVPDYAEDKLTRPITELDLCNADTLLVGDKDTAVYREGGASVSSTAAGAVISNTTPYAAQITKLTEGVGAFAVYLYTADAAKSGNITFTAASGTGENERVSFVITPVGGWRFHILEFISAAFYGAEFDPDAVKYITVSAVGNAAGNKIAADRILLIDKTSAAAARDPMLDPSGALPNAEICTVLKDMGQKYGWFSVTAATEFAPPGYTGKSLLSRDTAVDDWNWPAATFTLLDGVDLAAQGVNLFYAALSVWV
jgi:hypothetical protein